jgi:endonuclease YncB( thermonuclease family)
MPVGRRAQVVRVVDGDTIIVSIDGQKRRVRYIGIDCPEMSHSGNPREWMAREASEANERLVGSGVVYLERDVSDTDRYGRLLRYVWVGDKMVNAELVRLGYAHAITYPPDVKHQDLLRAMQREAQEAQRGLWGEMPTETAPAKASESPSQPQGDTLVVISHIFYDGVVKRVESDEYAEISNNGGICVDLRGWRLNADDPGQDFIFPAFTLGPGGRCRVYTNEHHPESGGFTFASGGALWNNRDRECGHLYDSTGRKVSTYCY